MLTGRQPGRIRTIAEISQSEIADEMLVGIRCIKSVEYGLNIDKATRRYYELSLKIMINNLEDEDKQSICLNLLEQYNEYNANNANNKQPLLFL